MGTSSRLRLAISETRLLIGRLGLAVDLDPGSAIRADQVDVGLVDDQVGFQVVGVADLAERLCRA